MEHGLVYVGGVRGHTYTVPRPLLFTALGTPLLQLATNLIKKIPNLRILLFLSPASQLFRQPTAS